MSSHLQGKNEPYKIIILFWWMCCIILGAIYGGNLVAFLTVQKITTPFNNLGELVEQDTYHFGTLSGTAFVDFLKVKVKTSYLFPSQLDTPHVTSQMPMLCVTLAIILL